MVLSAPSALACDTAIHGKQASAMLAVTLCVQKITAKWEGEGGL